MKRILGIKEPRKRQSVTEIQINGIMESEYENLQLMLQTLTDEHNATLQKQKETEEKLKTYENVAQQAYEEVGYMQTQLQDEQRCLERAVRVASRLYSRNTELKRLSIRRKTQDLSDRRQKWRDMHEKEEDATQFETAETITELGPDGNEEDSNEVANQESKTEDSSDETDELDVIVKLDKKSKTDVEKAQEEILKLRKINDEMSTKLQKYEDKQMCDGKNTVEHLQAVIKMQDAELVELKQKYSVESQVRLRAETYAAKMYGKNKAFQRNSVILKNRDSGTFDEKLQETMKEVQKLAEELEEEKVKNKQEVARLREELDKSQNSENEKALEKQLNLLRVEIDQLKSDKKEIEDRNELLKKEIEEAKSNTGSDLPPSSAPAPPPPPPPPPPPLPLSTTPKEAVKSIQDIIAERKAQREGVGSESPKNRKISSSAAAPSGYADAMEEMMRRIKSGSALKKTSTLPSNMRDNSEFPGIAETLSESDGSDENEYENIYSLIGGGNEKTNASSNSDKQNIKFATIGGYGARKSGLGGSSGQSPKLSMFQWPNLKPVTSKDKTTVDEADNSTKSPNRAVELKKTSSPFTREGFQDSVRLPKDISPDLKRILDGRRRGIKKAQSEGGK